MMDPETPIHHDVWPYGTNMTQLMCDNGQFTCYNQQFTTDIYSDGSSSEADYTNQCSQNFEPSYYPYTHESNEYSMMNNVSQGYVYDVNHDRAQVNYRESSPEHVFTMYENDDSNSSVEVPNYYPCSDDYGYQDQSYNVQTHNSLPHFNVFEKKATHHQSKRGRPVTYHKPGHNFRENGDTYDSNFICKQSAAVQRCKRGAKNILLWKFLLEELRKKQGHIKWEDENDGTFKFVDTTECSRRWGLMKKKEDMNFEKLSRGIRHYYRDGLMSRKDGIRLVYKFNWSRVPRAYWPKCTQVR